MKQMSLQVVVKRVGEPAKIEAWTISWNQVGDAEKAKENRASAGLKVFQQCVEGSIEGVFIGGGVTLYCNGYGLHKQLRPNACGYVGTFCFSKCDRHGWPQPLSDEECRKCLAWVERYKDVPCRTGSGEFKVMVGEEAMQFSKQQQELARMREEEWQKL